MRQLKFRVWESRFKRWGRYPYAFTLDRNFNLAYTENSGTLREEDFIIQQFTGLKDSLGVEIYEGDIVSYHFDNPEVFWNDLVAWGEAGWVFQNFDGTESGESRACEYKHLRVVGNIFENRELLDPAPKTL